MPEASERHGNMTCVGGYTHGATGRILVYRYCQCELTRARQCHRHGGHPIMLNQVGREMHTADVDWPDPPLPLAAAERNRIGALLILLALMGLVAMVVSFLAR